MQHELRFNVFGRLMAVVRSGNGWQVFYLGPEGKRRPADIAVPATLSETEIGEYLADLFHEAATPRNSEVVRLA